MKTWKKVTISIGVVLVVLAIVGFTVQQSRKGVVQVQTGKVVKADINAQVTASGEIKPKTYANVGANAFGRITKLHVKEGDKVKRGDLLAQLENVQPAADVQATAASLEASRTDFVAAQAGLKTSQADLNRARADEEQKRLDFQRATELYKSQLIPKSEYDTRKAAFDSATAGLEQAQARIAQNKAQADSAEGRIRQTQATLRRASDVLSKTEYRAPFDGVVTNLPVRQGETVVVGIQNSPGSTLMTIADMSVITAEVKVDETDIVNVKLGQLAEVSIDAIPKKKFKGVVTEIGNNAVLRSTGLSTAQTTGGSQEAKDFKVVITLQDPPENLRPGLSATAKVITATRQNTLAIPIQALTIRQKGDLEPKDSKAKGTVQAAAPEQVKAAKEEIQGVFVIRDKKAEFVPVETGVTGTTDIEVTKGLNEGDEVVTGSYKVLRTLRNKASVKIDNAAPKKAEEEQS
ncbi:MAG TPA: efflux RND transporter periplasmic adaptor subunit [Clostridia bacterium]|nr:efflux RND transporter periplasmic adaptor subunit [Clostridia bacterium]